jgi:hypothetical protein
MPDVKHIHPPLSFLNAIDHSINVRQTPEEQVAKPGVFRRLRTPLGMLFQAQDRILKPSIPFQCCVRMLGVYLLIEVCKVPFGPGREPNEISHFSLRSL